jgi:hypothetical protein
MTNQQVWMMVERFHKPAQNVKIKAAYVMIGLGIIGVAILAIKSSTTKSKEIRYLKDILTNNHETINSLTSRTAMLEYDLEQKVSIIESITYENKDLTVKLDKASNSNKA